MAKQRIVILTGAGLSAESGLDTFRDAQGIWAKYDYNQVATPEGFAADPDLVHEFYNQRRSALHGVEANDAHRALAKLEASFPGDVLIVTQNIDSLHEAAGSKNLIHMHGELLRALCGICRVASRWHDDLSVKTECPKCSSTSCMRPDVVWFGEMPYEMERITGTLQACTMFVSIGTSGHVYPAAAFVEIAREAGAKTVELNLEPSQQASHFHESIIGPATQVVPQFVDHLISSIGQQTGSSTTQI